ncbi:MAG: C1 family peptidase [bacterium]|nr:C1 family peptidase [bacterium]
MRITKLFLFTLALSTSLCAQDIKVVGTLERPLHNSQFKSSKATHAQRQIKLLKVELNQPANDIINRRTDLVLNKSTPVITSTFTPNLPRKIDLGMNDVPVLDQGNYGSCVTFATTTALNAAMNQGDYISQLCQLQLGNYLETNGYIPSGWNGSLGRTVLSQIDTFGIINKEKQKIMGCGGLTQYPSQNEAIPTTSISVEQFKQLSENLNEKTGWSPILDLFTAIERVDTNKTISDIKIALNENDRVTVGVLLLDFDLGLMGAVGTHNAKLDTWVLTPEIARDIYLRPTFGGHEMVITGYDDDATAVDDQGRVHKGLFSLRNSWGDKVGNKGDFYMSYDYFKVLVIEAQRIHTMPADGGMDSIRA